MWEIKSSKSFIPNSVSVNVLSEAGQRSVLACCFLRPPVIKLHCNDHINCEPVHCACVQNWRHSGGSREEQGINHPGDIGRDSPARGNKLWETVKHYC